MARPERHDADYFPFYVKDGKTLFILESKYGLQGIGFFTNLMRFLTRQTDHHICIQDESDRLYFFAQIRCPEDIGMDMISLMVKTGKIDSMLWDEKRVIVSDDLLKSLKDAYKNRNNPIISIDQIRVSYQIIPVTYQGNTAHAELNPKIEDHNPQRKGKETKGKESIEVGLSDLPVDNSKPPLEEKPKITPVPKSRHHKKETTEAEKKELQELIQQVAILYPYDRYKFNPLLWIQNHISAHPQAVIQTFRRLIEESEKGTKITIVRAYADKVVEEITKTMNADDVVIEAQGFKAPPTRQGMAAMSQIMAGMGRPSP